MLAKQNLIARTNLLYISCGEAIIMFLVLINGRSISNPYFKLGHVTCGYDRDPVCYKFDPVTLWE